MLIKRNNMPKVTIFKHKDVMDSYVSRNETNGIVSNITNKINNHIQMIHNNIGLEFCEVPREAITEIEKNIFKRDPLIENIDGLEKRNDFSMSDNDIISYDRSNNVIGMITSDNLNSNFESTNYTGVYNKLYGKISYNEKNNNSVVSDFLINYNPYNEYNLTDIIKSFVKNGVIYSIHRGGYITIYTIETKVSKVVSFIEEFSLYESISIKNDTYFNKFELSNVVTNASFNNESLIVITTTSNSIIFNIENESYNILPLTVDGETIIEIQIYNSMIYYITNTGDKEYKLFKFNIITSEKDEITIINKDEYFFPNTIIKIGTEIIMYESVSKFGKHLTTDIEYIHILNESDLTSIIKVQLDFPVYISSISGTLTEMRVGLVSEEELLEGSLIVINNDNIKLFNKNINIIGKNIKEVFHDETTLVTISNKNISFIYIDSGTSQISCINDYDLCKNRNSGIYITDCSVNDERQCIVTFDDNTQRVINIDEIVYSNLYTSKKKSLFSVVNGNKQTFIKNDKMYTIEDNNLNSLVITEYSNIYSQVEFNSISLFYYLNIDDSNSNIIIMTNDNSFTRVTMLSLTIDTETKTLNVLNNVGIGSIISSDINLIRNIDNKILIPINKDILSSNKTFLIVCDFNKNIFIRNTLSTLLSEYTKTLFINIDDNDNVTYSIGIDFLVYRTSLIDSLITIDSTVNVIQNVENDLFIDNSVETLNKDNVLQDYAYINGSGFIVNLLTLNNNVIFDKASRLIFLENEYIFISKKDIKIYNSEFQLKSICKNKFETDNIVCIQKVSNYLYILFTNSGNIYIDLENIDNRELSSITYENKNIKYCKNSGLIVINDGLIVSVIDTINDIYYYDIVNRSTLDSYSSKQFDDEFREFKVDAIERVNSSIYVSISYFNKQNGFYLGSFVINIYGLYDIKYIELTDVSSIEINTQYIDCNYTDMVVKDDYLCILYYNMNKIDCKFIDIYTFEEINVNNIYVIPSFVFYSGMIANEDNLYVLTTDGNVSATSYDEKQYIEPSVPIISDYYKIIIKDKNSFSMLVVNYYDLTIKYKFLSYGASYCDYYYENVDNTSLFQFIQDNWKDIRLSIGELKICIYNDQTKESILIDSDRTYSFINGYKLFNIVKTENFYLNSFFNYFTNGFVSFDNMSGLSHESYGKKYTTLGDFIFDKEDIFINYEVNKYSCIKNNSFVNILNVDIYSNDFMSYRVFSKILNTTKQINFCFKDECVIFSDSKYLKKENDEITLMNNNPLSFESYHYKIMEHECKVILKKDDENIFGYKQCIFIDSLNSIQTIELNTGLEIKPIYVDVDENLHSIIKSGGNVFYLNGTDTINSVLIQNFINVVDAIKVQDIEDSILLINQQGDVVVFNVNTLDYKTIPFVSSCIIGLSDNYTFERIINLSDSYTCVIIVKNIQTNNYHIIPNCSIELTLDSFENPVFEIKTINIGVIKSQFVDQLILSPFNVPTTNLISGLNFNSCIKTLDNNNYDINITVSIGNINIDGELKDNINNYSHTYITNNRVIRPKIFIRNNFFTIQYGKKIVICELIDKYIPNFIPFCEITQNEYSKTKILTDVMINGRNILFTFSDKTCRVVDLISSLDDQEQQITFKDDGFKYYVEYTIPSNDEDLKTFITESGFIGYFTNNLIYIYKKDENRFVNVPTTTNVKYFCVDILYNKIYCMDNKNNFGYIDISNYKYVPIKAFTDITIINVIYSVYNTVEILTNKGIFIYINGNLYQITNKEPDGKDLIIYPYKEYSN